MFPKIYLLRKFFPGKCFPKKSYFTKISRFFGNFFLRIKVSRDFSFGNFFEKINLFGLVKKFLIEKNYEKWCENVQFRKCFPVLKSESHIFFENYHFFIRNISCLKNILFFQMQNKNGEYISKN